MSRLSALLLLIALGTVGAVWIPVLHVGALELELANFATLIVIACTPVFILWQRAFQAPAILNVLLMTLGLIAVDSLLRGAGDTGLVVRSVAALLAAYAVVNLEPLAERRLRVVVAAAFLVFSALMAVSSHAAGVDLFQSVWTYFTTLDRDAFVYRAIRPIWNAHVAGDEVEYTASVINSVSAAFALFFLLAGSLATEGSRLMLAVAVGSLLVVVTLFSTSAVLACMLGGAVLALRQFTVSALRRSPAALVLPALVVLLVSFAAGLGDYVASNVGADTTSRAERINQYMAALALIDGHPVLGAGLVEVGGHKIHNFLLFSWTTAGMAGLVLSVVVYIATTVVILEGMAGALRRAEFPADYLMMATLPILFLVRISVGGGGGLPAGAGMLALAIALQARRRLRRSGARFLFDVFRQRITPLFPVGFAARHAPERSRGETTRPLPREQ